MKRPRLEEPPRSNPFTNRKVIASVLALVYVVAIAALIYFLIYPALDNQQRESRIRAIYNSLKLDSKYIIQKESIFGKKQPHEWDPARSQSSSREYIRAADVKTTVTEVKRAIEKAGFTYLEEPYPGSAQVQYHFKSQKNEYIRMIVSSKPRDDTIQNKALMKLELTDADFALDPNTGPSNVIIKVNLDDNNE